MDKETSISQAGSATGTPSKNGKWQSPGNSSPETSREFQDQVIGAAKVAYDKFVDVAGDTWTKANRKAIVLTRQYPVQVATGALAVGFILGATLFRRRA